jgi:hypothetical protein
MLSIRLPQYAPPGGQWFYTVPETGRAFASSAGIVDVERAVVGHLEAAKLEIPLDLRQRIEHYMCQRLPEGLCIGDGTRLPGQTAPTYFGVLAELPKLQDKALVAPHLAEARATVCKTCPNNNLGLCTSCNNLQDQTLRYVGQRRVVQLPYLGVCTFYGVPNYGLVWLQKPWAKAGLPDNCWAKEPKGTP